MKIKVVNKQLKKINEAESTMPPMGAQSTMPPNLKSPQKQQKRVPKPPPPLPVVDRAEHYKKHSKSINRIVNNWLQNQVLGKNANFSIEDVIKAIQNDETLLNRLDLSVEDGFISDRTRQTIIKIANSDETTINLLKKEVSRLQGGDISPPSYDLDDDDEEAMPSVDSMVNTFKLSMQESISINVLEHLKQYLYLFSSESWYGLDYSAAKVAMFGTPSMVKRDLVETALSKWINEGWTPMKSSINKAKYMKDYDMSEKWPDHVYELRENIKKIKIKIV